jgi:5'-nucleotidase (lipoprotein e(P4) family)
MSRPIVLFLLFLAVGCSSTRDTPATSVKDVDEIAALSQQAADAVLWQFASAEAHRLYQQCYELARIRLTENLKKVTTGTPAVIVDIDETVLDNSPYEVHIIANDQIYEDASWKEWTSKAQARALPGSVEFLLHAAEQGCEIYYISNRHVSEAEATLKNLRDLKFPFADEAHLLLMKDVSDKTQRRKAVSEKHPVVLVVGDQLRDMDERFKDRSIDNGKALVDQYADTLRQYFIMLPNPMYGTWRDVVQGKGTPEEKLQRMNSFFKTNSY